MRVLTMFVAVTVSALLCVGSTFAWNDAGHLTIARIAWERLNDSQREKVVAILRKHPHRDELLLKNRPDDATEAEWIFLRAAVSRKRQLDNRPFPLPGTPPRHPRWSRQSQPPARISNFQPGLARHRARPEEPW